MKQPALGKKILELRLSRGLTQGELAEKCNLSLRTIQRIETSEVSPRSHTIRIIFSNLDYEIYNSFGRFSYKLDRIWYKLKLWFGKILRFILELINLKKNTMKKLSVLSLIVIFVCAGILLSNENANAQVIGWSRAGNASESYIIGLDKTIVKSGESSAFLESIDKKIEGFGTLAQSCSAEKYLGKRVKLTAYIKAENVENTAGMWWRVDGKEGKRGLSFDNMHDRPIKGTTEWIKYETTLDVPLESGNMSFGILMEGTGKLWIDNVSFKVISKMTPRNQDSLPLKPFNLDFDD
jgi:transcriptional regulator with XRE-family HTH domain